MEMKIKTICNIQIMVSLSKPTHAATLIVITTPYRHFLDSLPYAIRHAVDKCCTLCQLHYSKVNGLCCTFGVKLPIPVRNIHSLCSWNKHSEDRLDYLLEYVRLRLYQLNIGTFTFTAQFPIPTVVKTFGIFHYIRCRLMFYF